MTLPRKLGDTLQGLGLTVERRCMTTWTRMRGDQERRRDGLVGLSYVDPKNLAGGHMTGYTVFAPAFLIQRKGGYARRDYDKSAVPVDTGDITQFYGITGGILETLRAKRAVLIEAQEWDGRAHSALAAWAAREFTDGGRVAKGNEGVLGWSLQNNEGAGNYALRFVSGANQNHFDPKPKPSFWARHLHPRADVPTEIRDLPAHWTRWLSDQLARSLGLELRDYDGKPYTYQYISDKTERSRVAFVGYFRG